MRADLETVGRLQPISDPELMVRRSDLSTSPALAFESELMQCEAPVNATCDLPPGGEVYQRALAVQSSLILADKESGKRLATCNGDRPDPDNMF
ncbi:hypothetical protein IMZ48_43730 [Candidatus Bathyarchaeota archaeon]|nr:hypothetical protein [Candidatus Bathyarchaeota archaeon]